MTPHPPKETASAKKRRRTANAKKRADAFAVKDARIAELEAALASIKNGCPNLIDKLGISRIGQEPSDILANLPFKEVPSGTSVVCGVSICEVSADGEIRHIDPADVFLQPDKGR